MADWLGVVKEELHA